MKNPYALPLRLRRQHLGDLRQAAAAIQGKLGAAQSRDAAFSAEAAVERKLRSSTPDISADSWFARHRRTRAALANTLIELACTLEGLRAEMRDELGQISALEKAERRLLAEERRRLDRRAQAAADDRAAALFLVGAPA